MRCIERYGLAKGAAALPFAALLCALLAGCAAPGRAPLPVPEPAPAPAQRPGRVPADVPGPPATVVVQEPRYVQLGTPPAPRSPEEFRRQFADRLVLTHPQSSYRGTAPARLLAIPVIEVEFNADGSVRRIDVLRKPTTGDEATLLAIAAIRRAAPYGDLSGLPKPWKLVEVFLFDDELRFKPQTLELD